MKVFLKSQQPNSGDKRGFTLIELLMVIAIISLLSAIVLAPLNSARVRSRDLARVTTLREIRTALDQYRNDAGQYPRAVNSSGALSFVCFDCTTAAYLTDNVIAVDPVNTTATNLNSSALITKKYLPTIPRDPKSISGSGGYLYRSDGKDYCLMSYLNPENMKNFATSLINQNLNASGQATRCGLPITASGNCTDPDPSTAGGTTKSIYMTSGGVYATQKGC